jgi:hypothetical protein
MDVTTTATVKAKKERKPFEWTEARKAAFERCKKARDVKLVSKAKAQSEGKTYESSKQKQMQNLVKNAALLRKLLDGIEEEKKVEEKVKPPPAEIIKEKKEVKEKPRKIAPPIPPPQAESSEEEEEEEPVFVAPPKKNVNPFRYNTVSSKQFVPKAPIPTQQRFQQPQEHQQIQQQPKKAGYLFL